MTRHQADQHGLPESGGGFEDSLDYVTVMIGDQMLGMPIGRVHDVFIATRITQVPRAPAEIVGLLNRRGKVVTAICLRKRLGRPVSFTSDCDGKCELTAVGIDHDGEAYALIVDAVGEVMRLDSSTLESLPAHLDRSWSALATGVHRLENRLLVVLDMDAVLRIDLPAAA
jgi:purine-binding chemotaxis protein CheW